MADEQKPVTPSAPATGANPAATPQHRPVPGGDAPATAAAAAATGATPVAPAPAAAGAHAARPAPAPRPPAAPIPDLAGKTTNAASPGGAAARTAAPAAAKAATRDPDDTSPLLTRRAWMGLAWGAFSAASAAALAATGRGTTLSAGPAAGWRRGRGLARGGLALRWGRGGRSLGEHQPRHPGARQNSGSDQPSLCSHTVDQPLLVVAFDLSIEDMQTIT